MTAAHLVTLLALRAALEDVLPTAPWEVRNGTVLNSFGRPMLVSGSAASPLFLRYIAAFDPSVAKMMFRLLVESAPVWSWEPPLLSGRYYARRGPNQAVQVFLLCNNEQGLLCPDDNELQPDLALEALRGVWQWAKLPDPIDLAR